MQLAFPAAVQLPTVTPFITQNFAAPHWLGQAPHVVNEFGDDSQPFAVFASQSR
jgi:hypothetical protein